MPLFDDWCDCDEELDGRKCLWRLTEKEDGRTTIEDALAVKIRSHYSSLDTIADDIEELGFTEAAAILKELLPETKRGQSGDLGEILAMELTEEKLGFQIPVRRLRYKDSRELPLRGDDFIGVQVQNNQLRLLKGEAKSRRNLGPSTVRSARNALNRSNGRPTPSSLLFVANRLLEAGGAQGQLGRKLRNEVARRALVANDIEHVILTFSQNDPSDALSTDLEAAEAGRDHTSISLRIDDHQAFIAEMYEKAGDLGDD